MADVVVGYALFGWAPFGCLVVGLSYLAVTPAQGSTVSRFIPGAYAPLAALLYLAIVLAPHSFGPLLNLKETFFTLHALPLALMAVSMYRFRGPRWVHGVLVPVAVVCMGWQLAWAYWDVFGK